jgi:hypothetical protein
VHQTDLARKAWQAAGLYSARDPSVQAFLKNFEAAPTLCWPDLIAHCRINYPKSKARLAQPLWDTNDKLLRLNLIRNADPSQQDEMQLVSKWARSCHPYEDELELRAMIELNHPALLKQLTKKRFTPELQGLLAMHAAQSLAEMSTGDA